MRRTPFLLSALLLALIAFAAVPVTVADTPAAETAPTLELAEEPNLTPVPDLPVFEDPAEALKVRRIEVCEPDDPRCPPGCTCQYIVRNKPVCNCP